MSDQKIAAIGRDLAHALARFARDRRDEDRKVVNIIQTELCAAVATEEIEAAIEAQQQQTDDSNRT
jgi:hypothetical protein